MTELQTPKAILFLDFDGTITQRDAVDAILEVYADPKWLTLEAEWRAGRMGSRYTISQPTSLATALTIAFVASSRAQTEECTHCCGGRAFALVDWKRAVVNGARVFLFFIKPARMGVLPANRQ